MKLVNRFLSILLLSMFMVAVIACPETNPFKEVAKPGIYESEDGAYKFFLTDSSAYKAVIGGKIYFGKGETKDDNYRGVVEVFQAATEQTTPTEIKGEAVGVRYQAGSVAKIIKGEDKKLYYQKTDGTYVALNLKSDLATGIADVKLDGKAFKFDGKGQITEYKDATNPEDRPRGGSNTNTAEDVVYNLSFKKVDNIDTVTFFWTEAGVKKYMKGKYTQVGYRINMEIIEFTDDTLLTPVVNSAIKKLAYAVIDPAAATIGSVIAIENASLNFITTP